MLLFSNILICLCSRSLKELKPERTRFLFIPNSLVPLVFMKSQIVVLPYVQATQSGIVPLAFTFGKPVIATNVGSIPEVVIDNYNGLIIPPGDSESLANSIISLLNDSKLIRYLGSNAKKTSETLLSWEKIAEKTEEVYKSCLINKGIL